MTTTRRQLLLMGVRMGAGGCLLLIVGGCGPAEEPRTIDVSAVLPEPRLFVPMGVVYRQDFSAKVSEKVLERRLFENLPEAPSIQSAVNDRLSKMIREDFAARQTFLFEGWILSHTEGQLCALAVDFLRTPAPEHAAPADT